MFLQLAQYLNTIELKILLIDCVKNTQYYLFYP